MRFLLSIMSLLCCANPALVPSAAAQVPSLYDLEEEYRKMHQRFAEKLQSANYQLEKGRADQALVLIQQLMDDPDYLLMDHKFLHVVRATRGLALLTSGKPEKAIDDFTSAIRLERQWQPVFHRGRAYAAIGDHENAIADYSSALELSPPRGARATLLYLRALGRLALDDSIAALADLDGAISTVPRGDYFSVRGELHLSRGDRAAAKQDFDQALVKGVDVPARRAHIYLLRGKLRHAAKDFDGALADYGEVITTDAAAAETRLQARVSRAFVHHLQGDVEQAMLDYDAFFTGLAGAQDESRQAAAGIIAALRRAGHYDGNAEHYDAALRDALKQCIAAPDCRF